MVDLTRYPFRHVAIEYLRAYRGLFAESTYVERERRYRKMAKDLERMFTAKRISSSNPGRMTPEDVKEFYLMLKDRGLSQNGIAHELTALRSICMFAGNTAVDLCRQKYPMVKGRNPSFRLPTTPYPTLNRIVETGERYETAFGNIRNYAVVLCAYCAGLRPWEISNARVENININMDEMEGTIYVDVVKGQDTYGEPREAPIHPSGLKIINRYIELRNAKFGNGGYLFTTARGTPLSTNTLRKYKSEVESEIGYDFDFREGRRTYGQMLIDESASVEDVALCIGHTTSKTTEKYYARRTQRSALSNVFNIWKNKREKDNES